MIPTNHFQDKLVLVTGAGAGMGAAIARGFATHGAHVIVADRNEASARKVADEIVAGKGRASAVALDVSDREGVARVAREIDELYGAIHVLINNAGVSGRMPAPGETELDVWDQVLAVNLSGTYNVVRAFTPALESTHGAIVNFASIVAFVAGSSTPSYVASKGGVRSLTQVLARDLGPRGIRVNAVAPGFMMTDMVKPQLAVEGGTDWYMSRAPLRRGGEPKEIVGPVMFLASDLASYVHGAVLPVDGGFLAA